MDRGERGRYLAVNPQSGSSADNVRVFKGYIVGTSIFTAAIAIQALLRGRIPSAGEGFGSMELAEI